MSYAYSHPTFFLNPETKEAFTCYSQGTSYGFRHIAFKGLELQPQGNKPDSKVSYYNRTWERYQFETVLRKITNNTDQLQKYYDIERLIQDKNEEVL